MGIVFSTTNNSGGAAFGAVGNVPITGGPDDGVVFGLTQFMKTKVALYYDIHGEIVRQAWWGFSDTGQGRIQVLEIFGKESAGPDRIYPSNGYNLLGPNSNVQVAGTSKHRRSITFSCFTSAGAGASAILGNVPLTGFTDPKGWLYLGSGGVTIVTLFYPIHGEVVRQAWFCFGGGATNRLTVLECHEGQDYA